MKLPLTFLKLRTLKNRMFPVTGGKAVRFAVISLLGGIFFLGAYWLFSAVIDYLMSLEDFEAALVVPFLERLMAMVYLLSLSMLIFSNIITSLSSLYLSRDLDILFSMPYRHITVFFHKVTGSVANSSYIVVFFLIPVLIAYGRGFGAGATYYTWIIPSTVLFLIPPAVVGVLITLVLMRILPAHKTYRVMMVLGLIFLVCVIMFIRMLQPERLFNPETTDDFVTLIKSITIPGYELLPGTWAARIQFGLLTGDQTMFRESLINLALLCGFGLLLLIPAAYAFYFKGWTESRRSEKVTLKRKKRPSAFALLLRALFGQKTGALLSRDIKLFFRETSQWSQLLLLGALVVIYVYNIANIPFPHPALKNAISFLNLGMAGFVLTAVAVRFVYPAVSTEARSFWLIKSSPVKTSAFLREKFLISFIPLFILAEILVISSNIILEVDAFLMVLSVVTILFISLALTGFGVGLGAVYPDFYAENPNKVAAGTGGILYMLTSLIYVGFLLLLEAKPVYYHFTERYLGREVGTGSVIRYVIAIALSLALTLVPMWIGARKLDKREF